MEVIIDDRGTKPHYRHRVYRSEALNCVFSARLRWLRMAQCWRYVIVRPQDSPAGYAEREMEVGDEVTESDCWARIETTLRYFEEGGI